MNIQELYDLMSKRLDEMSARTDARFSEVIQRLEGIDERLRGVETKVAELQGRKMGVSTVRDWIVGLSAVCALSNFAHRAFELIHMDGDSTCHNPHIFING